MNTCEHYSYVKTKAYVESLKDVLANNVLVILTTYRESGLQKRSIRHLQQLKEKTYLENLVLSIIAIDEING